MDIHEENMQVVNLSYAMLGSITPNFRAVFLEFNVSGLRLHFLLEHECAEDREVIDDIEFDFEALQVSNIDIELIVIVDVRPLVSLNIPGRMIYHRKESMEST